MAKVTVYEFANQTGLSQELGPGRYPAEEISLADNSISSIKVPPGWKVALWSDNAFTGASTVVTTDVANLGTLSLDDSVSSLTVTAPNDGAQKESTGSLGFLNAGSAKTYVNLQPLSILFSGTNRGFTFETWIWFDSNGYYSRIFDFFQSVTVDNIILSREGSSNNLVFLVCKSSVQKSIVARGVIENGQWMHIAVTIDSAGYGRIYSKGTLVAEGQLSVPDSITRSSAWLGRSPWSQDAYFAGQMAEVRIWSVARSADEIKRTMNTRLIGTEANLERYFRMDEPASCGGTLRDLSGHNSALVSGTALYALSGPKLAMAADSPGGLSFNGLTDYLTLPAMRTDFSSGFTLEGWVYFESVTSWARIFDLGNGPGAENIILARREISNTLSLFICRGSAVDELFALDALPIKQWIHVAATLDIAESDGRGSASLYVNGILKASGRLGMPNHLVRTVCYIGKSPWAADGLFCGRMAELRIWNRARSADQILSALSQRLDPSEPGLCAYYPLDEVSSTVAHDVSASGLDAPLIADVSWNRPLAGISALVPPQTSLLVDGTDTYVQLPSLSATFSAGFTLEAWVYADTVTRDARIVDLGRGSAADNIILSRSGTSNHLLLSIFQGAASETLTAADALPTGRWLHVAVTQDVAGSDGKATATIYVNGVVCATGRMSLPASVDRTLCLVGRSPVSGEGNFKGRVAELRLWTCVRTQAELQKAMNRSLLGSEPGLYLYYPLAETSGQSAEAKLVPASPSLPPCPEAMTTVFHGSHVLLPSLSADFSRGFTLEAWVLCEVAGPYARIIELGCGPGLDTIILARVGTGNDLGLWVTRENAAEKIEAKGPYVTGRWLHVAATLGAPGSDGRGTATIYVNGVSYGTGRLALPRNLTRTVCTLGKSPWAVDPLFKGRMTEVRVWNRERTQAEIQASMNSTVSGQEDGLCLYRPLCDRQSAAVYGKATRHLADAPLTTLGSLAFDGLDDAVQLSTLDADLSRGFSLEAWLYLDALTAGSTTVVDLATATGTDRLTLSCEGTRGDLVFENVNAGGAPVTCRATGALNAERWIHVAATLSGVASGVGVLTLYVNGVAASASGGQSFSAPRYVIRNSAWVGKPSSGTANRLRGRLTDLRIFSRARSVDEIKANLTQPLVGQEEGLLRYHPLDEVVGTQVRDVAQQNGALVGSVSWEELPHSKSMAFDGVDTCISLPSFGTNLSQGFTIEAWVMFRGRDYSTAIIDLGSGTEIDNVLIASETTTRNLRLYTFAATMGVIEAVDVITDNVWMHVAATMGSIMPNGTGFATLYINGVAKARGRIPVPRNVTRTASFIGKCAWSTYRLFRGRMSDVRVWTVCRSGAEIQTMMRHSVPANTVGLHRNWRLDDTVGAAVLESVSGGYSPVLGRPEGGLAFNGRTDYVQLPTLIWSTPRTFTLEARVYFASSDFWARIFDLGNGQAVDNIVLARNGTSNTLSFVIYAPSGISQLHATNVIVNNQWMHVAATFDGASTGRIYVNGVLVATGSMFSPSGVDRSSCFVGKSNWASDALFRGSMSEIRIFNVERTQAEILSTRDTALSGGERGLRYYFRLGRHSSYREQNTAFPMDGFRQYRQATLVGTASDTRPLLPDPRALRFDGRSGMVDLPGQEVDLSAGLAVEAWVCFSGTPRDNEVLIAFGGGSRATSVLLWRDHAANQLVLTVGRAPTGSNFRFALARSSDTWMHMAVTVDSSRTVQVHVNGDLLVVGTLSSTDLRPLSSEFRSRLGMGIDGNSPFQGYLTEVRLWRQWRSGIDVFASRSKRLMGTEAGLLRYYPLTESWGTVARQWPLHEPGIVLGDPRRLSRRLAAQAPASSGALEWNGTSTYVALPPIRTDFSSGLTIEAWVYFDGVQPGSCLVELGRGELADTISLGRAGSSAALVLQVMIGDHIQQITTSDVITDKTWMHIAATVPGSYGPAKIYANGALASIVSSTSGPGCQFLPPSSGWPRSKSFLGRSSRELPLFKGRMAEVRLWRRERTSDEIRSSMSYSLTDEDPTLAAYYRLDEVEGTQARDSTSARLFAEVRGARPVWGAPAPYFLPAPTALGTLAFSGRSDWVELPAITADFSSGFTIEAWVLFGGSEAWARILELSNGWNVDSIIVARDGSTSNLGLSVRGSSQSSSLIASAVIQNGQWMHVAVTLGNVANGVGQATIYIDGQIKAQGSCVVPTSVTRQIAYLGKSTASWDPLFVGRQAELRIWTVCRSMTDIQRNRQTRLLGSEAGLFAYYRLNESVGERAGDASRHRLHGMVRGAAGWSQSAPMPSIQPSSAPIGVLRLDGPTWISLPALLEPSDEGVAKGFCLEAWVWCSDVTRSGNWLSLGNGVGIDELSLGQNGSAIRLGVQAGSQPVQQVTASGVLSAQQWTHISASIDENGHVCLYKNGQPVLADKNSVVIPRLLARSRVQLGCSLTGAAFDGYLSEVRIFTTPKSPREVAATWQTTQGGAVTGLAGSYRLLAARGFSALDSGPLRRDGTIYGTKAPAWTGTAPSLTAPVATVATSVAAGSLTFDGYSTYLRLPPCAADLSSGFTFEATVYADGTAPVGAVLDLGNGTAGDNIQIVLRDDRRLHVRIYADATTYTDVVSQDPFVAAGSWAQCSFTLDSQRTVKLYQFGIVWPVTVNGVLGSTIPVGKMPRAGVLRSVGFLGKSSSATQRTLRGTMKEVRLWSLARTAVEIGTNWTKQLSGAEAGLCGLYRLSEVEGRLARGMAPAMGDAQLFGAAGWGLAAAQPVYQAVSVPQYTVKQSLAAPSGPLPVVGWQNVDPATLTTATWSATTGVDTGDGAINTALTAYATGGLTFSLLNVSAKVTMSGSVSVRPLTNQVALSLSPTITIDNSYTASLPQTVLTMTRGASPMVYALSFSPGATPSMVDLVRSAVKDPLLASTFDTVLLPFVRLVTDGTVLIANRSGTDPDLGDYEQGMNLFVSKAMSELPVLDLIASALPQLGLSSRRVVLAVSLLPTAGYKVSAGALLNIKLIDTGPVSLEFNELGIALSSAETSTSIGVKHRFTLTMLGETLVFRGGVSVAQTGGASAVTVWGALDPAHGATWKNPWGLPGLEIGGFGVQIRGGTALGIGCRGEVHVGGGLLGGTIALNLDTANPILLIDSPEGLDLPRLVSAFLPGVQGSLSGLDAVLAIRLKDLKLYFAPQGGEIAGQSFERGVSVGASLDLWGYRAKIFGRLDSSTGAVLSGEADRIKIDVAGITLLQFSDASGQNGPSIDVALTTARQGIFYSGMLRLLGGVYQGYEELSIGSDGISWKGGSPLGAMALALNWQERLFGLTVMPRFVYRFEALGIPVNVNIGAEVAQRIDKAGFQQSLTFWFSVCGVGFDVGPVGWSVPLIDIHAIGEVFESFFGDMVKRFFVDTLAGGLKQAYEWVRDNLTCLAEEAVELFKTAGAAVADIAKNIYSTFEATAQDVINFLGGTINEAADLLKGALSLAADEAAEILGAAYGVSADAVKSAMSFAGYTAQEIASVATTVWDGINTFAGYLDPTSW